MKLIRAFLDPEHSEVVKARASWRGLAEQLNLRYSEGDAPDHAPRLRGQLDGHRVTVDIVRRGAKAPRARATSIEASCDAAWPSGLTIESETNLFHTLLSGYVAALFPPDYPRVRILAPLLPRTFCVRAAQPERVRHLLAEPGLRAELVRATQLRGEWYVGGGQPRVRFSYRGVATDPGKLAREIRAVTSLSAAFVAAIAAQERAPHDEFSWTWRDNQRRNILLAVSFVLLIPFAVPLLQLPQVGVLTEAKHSVAFGVAVVASLWLVAALTAKNGQLSLTRDELSFRFGRRRARLSLQGLQAELRLGRTSSERELHVRNGPARLVLSGESDQRVMLPRAAAVPDCHLTRAAFEELVQRLRAAGALSA